MLDEYRALLMRLMRVNRICFLLSYAHLEELGLYPGQPQMLITLLGRDGISQRELAQAMSIKPATLTVMLRRMAGKGLVRRAADARDQRVTRLYLTQAGLETARRLEEMIGRMGREIFGVLQPEERAQLAAMLGRVAAAAQRRLSGEDGGTDE